LAIALLLSAAAAASAQAPKPAPKPAAKAETPPPPKPAVAAPARPASPQANRLAAAMSEFQKNLQAYLKLREDLAKKLQPLAPTASSSELAARQDALAAALKAARKTARQGDLIPLTTAKQIGQIVADDFRKRKPAATKAVFEEVPVGVQPAINKTIPDAAALATMPPLLLKNLPLLPDNLQYRLLQRDVIILDGDTRIIIDYISNVLPAH
jgi:hypothetical protein